MSRVPKSIEVEGHEQRISARPLAEPACWLVEYGEERFEVRAAALDSQGYWFTDEDGLRHRAWAAADERGLWLRVDGRTEFFESAEREHASHEGSSADPSQVIAPMTGTIVRILCKPGDTVSKDQDLAILSAMKMEHKLRAGSDGSVVAIEAEEGATIDAGALVLRLEV